MQFLGDGERGAVLISQSARYSKKITQEDINQFANLSGDFNPIHVDQVFAKETPFKKTVAHGLYVASLISKVIATQLPGPGTIYLQQDLKFIKPAFVGDEITAIVTILEYPKEKFAKLKTECVNQSGDLVIDGCALVKVI